jgi:hypothetical protein
MDSAPLIKNSTQSQNKLICRRNPQKISEKGLSRLGKPSRKEIHLMSPFFYPN